MLGFTAWEWSRSTSPGELHPSHTQVKELRGSKGCAQCHGKDARPMLDACGSCHKAVQEQIEAAHGLHGSIPPGEALVCGSCHREHTFGSVALVSDLSFSAAGIPDRRTYDHKHVPDFALKDRHVEIECQECHRKALLDHLPEGQPRFLGLDQACAKCHEDVHKASFGPGCEDCHGQKEEFRKFPLFVHTQEFPLVDAHSQASCDRCHDRDTPRSVGALLIKSVPARSCYQCHADPHKGAYGQDCANCHGTKQKFDTASEFQHTKDFPLSGGHANRACIACHEAGSVHSIAALIDQILPVRACGECHSAPHTTSFVVEVSASMKVTEKQSCAKCHQSESGTFLAPSATMSIEQHAFTGFPLSKPHQKVDCEKCHEHLGKREKISANADMRQQFSVLYPGRSPRDCASCHEDPHAGQFNAGWTGGRCVECHLPTHFEPTNFTMAMHEKSSFPLTDSHRAVACNSCHKIQNEVRQFVGTTHTCGDCHKDVHAGSFDAPGRPTTVNGQVGCARCHTPVGFREVNWRAADHDTWVGFELKGAHSKAQCADCHTRGKISDAKGMTLIPAPKECASCHQDPHAGQFRVEGVTDCARCHQESSFKDSLFDHQRDSRFKLDEDHIKLDCVACHKPLEVEPGVRVVRYKPLGTTCADCHGSREMRPRTNP